MYEQEEQEQRQEREEEWKRHEKSTSARTETNNQQQNLQSQAYISEERRKYGITMLLLSFLLSAPSPLRTRPICCAPS
ncbi:uncharacterized protein EAF01_006099 [Botrytis porri]|uniref:uncharacterized protein n=1 Tax=Botrytis porri TaxID=87229 RepID=UPI001901F16E|nr:uncharacterized protein EAF01_006099 [Botrytis porri]KAF7905578.1 hypothetical protein EAF01_006099 [Botrytis porri]